jgi:hypothetical protein
MASSIRLVDVESVLTYKVGTGAICGAVSGRNERSQPILAANSGPTLHRHDLRSAVAGRARQRSDLEAALIRRRAGHGGWC